MFEITDDDMYDGKEYSYLVKGETIDGFTFWSESLNTLTTLCHETSAGIV